jgi:hypothetical protein
MTHRGPRVSEAHIDSVCRSPVNDVGALLPLQWASVHYIYHSHIDVSVHWLFRVCDSPVYIFPELLQQLS